MSKRYKGAILSSTPPTTSTSSASGVWTEQQFMQGVASGSWPALAGAPTIGTATAGALSASVTFTAPTYTGSGITGYTVTSNPGGITGTGASSPVTVSGLTAGTAYTFTVTATTAAGQSSASAASNSVTPTAPNYIENVYSTYLYTGNDSSRTIENGIDLAGDGGLVWIKIRDQAGNHILTDTARGVNAYLRSNTTDASVTPSSNYGVTSFANNGFGLDQSIGSLLTNTTGKTYASWTFRKQPKFFDVVTYTGNGTSNRAVSHNLGSIPACIFLKRTDSAASWFVYHRATGGTPQDNILQLNTTDPLATSAGYWGTTPFTDTEFRVSSFGGFNASGGTYVAYIFAHDAGGFGLTGTDNVISCGSYTGNGSATGPVVTLGYEPQWLLVKNASASGGTWLLTDNMRGVATGGNDAILQPNTSSAEFSENDLSFTATGFSINNTFGYYNNSGDTYIYIAIRRGPMKVPTSGTSVFTPVAWTGTSSPTSITGVGFPPDMTFMGGRNINSAIYWYDKLRGFGNTLLSTGTGSEFNTNPYGVNVFQQDGFSVGYDIPWNYTGYNAIYWVLRRAPSFFDEVCYTGTGSAIAQSHNLGVTPEMIIVKSRSSASVPAWTVYVAPLGISNGLNLNTDGAAGSTASPITSANATTMTIRSFLQESAQTYVAYLFVTCAGVSKVGSYTGTGALQTINCGFAAGARFVLIKRTDSTGDWYTYDSARGITSSNDPYLLLNSTAAEVTGTNYVDTTSVGFQVTAAAPAGINASGGTYIFLAIA